MDKAMIREYTSIKKLIIHCSDSPNNRDIGLKEITEWHRQRGWKSCGYHFVIRRSGEIENGRAVKEIGAHCKDENSDSVGVCLVGFDKFEEKQFDSLKYIIGYCKKLCENINEIKGHRDYPSAKSQGKTCPSFDVSDWLIKENIESSNEKSV